ncbi:MAG: fructosamine kinase family protein [Asticcacaulis sp.]|nr:fructosamine kinase family protein [Asticcacaulis sp.]
MNRVLGQAVVRREVLAGGDLSRVEKLTLADGRQVVIKGGPFPRREAEMLQTMASAGVEVPEVLAVDDGMLVLSRVEDRPVDWRRLGEGLRRLHDVTGPRYGWGEDYAFGAVTILNNWKDDWPDFWAQKRLLPFVSCLPAATARRLEDLCRDLPNRLPARPVAALLHGDLWTGNVMGSVMIDPACYHGHGEVDLAMLNLFGRPAPVFYEAYGPEPDWRERQAIYALGPALVHFRLFGNAYLEMVERFLAVQA